MIFRLFHQLYRLIRPGHNCNYKMFLQFDKTKISERKILLPANTCCLISHFPFHECISPVKKSDAICPSNKSGINLSFCTISKKAHRGTQFGLAKFPDTLKVQRYNSRSYYFYLLKKYRQIDEIDHILSWIRRFNSEFQSICQIYGQTCCMINCIIEEILLLYLINHFKVEYSNSSIFQIYYPFSKCTDI